MLYLDRWHLGHQMAIVAFSIAILVLHQVHAVGVWIRGDLSIPIELRHKHLTTSAAVAAGRKAVWLSILADLVQAVRGDVANTLARSERT